MKKYSLTNNKIEIDGKTLFQIKAEISFDLIKKGDLGGYIEKEENLSQEDNAWIYEDAQISAKSSFTKGWFIGGGGGGGGGGGDGGSGVGGSSEKRSLY